MERQQKLRRLNDFRRALPHVSSSALSALLKEVEAHGCPELHGRSHVHEATVAEMNADTPYGSMLVDLDVVGRGGEHMQLVAVNPLAYICRAYEQGGAMTRLMDTTLRDHPPTLEAPWGLILYADEVVPGNAMSFDNRRKCWAVYCSFKQFGALLLQQEDSWFTILACRSSVIANVSGGISQVYGSIIKSFMPLASAGMALRRAGGQVRLWVSLDMIVQDGGAHKLTWHCKGAANQQP